MANNYKLCPKCNNALDITERECPYCGNNITFNDISINNTKGNNDPTNNDKKTGGRKGCTGCIIFYFIIHILIAIAIMLFSQL